MVKVMVNQRQACKANIKQPPEIGVRLNQDVSVSDDYLRLNNKPSVNGIVLDGDKTWSNLSLLSGKISEYKEISLGAAVSGSFLLVLTADEQTKKVKLSELTEGKVKTADDIPGDLQVGNYVFVKRR